MSHKILLVDDDKVNIALVRFGLAEKGYDVISASGGEEGIARVKEQNPDLIVLDVMMPNMNGYEFMAELKMFQGVDTTPVIMLTANPNMKDLFEIEGVKGYFVKPIEIETLIDRIVKCLGANSKK